jgi:hypothetical protein
MTSEVVHSAKEAFMSGMLDSAMAAACIIFAAAVVAFVGLPKHQKKDDDTV